MNDQTCGKLKKLYQELQENIAAQDAAYHRDIGEFRRLKERELVIISRLDEAEAIRDIEKEVKS